MNRDRAKEILEAAGHPTMQAPNGNIIVFSRQDMNDVEEIEKTETNALIEEWKGLVSCNYFAGSVSMGDLQRIALIEAEFETRLTPEEEESTREWYEEEEAKFAKEEEAGHEMQE